MNTPRDSSYENELIQTLANPIEAAAYLDAVMELEDGATLLLALRQVANAQSMTQTTTNASAGEKTLFNVLSAKGNLTLDTMNKVLHAMGLRLSVQPLTS